jgi:hypothetical protein
MFVDWAFSEDAPAYGSWGKGAPMRVAAVGAHVVDGLSGVCRSIAEDAGAATSNCFRFIASSCAEEQCGSECPLWVNSRHSLKARFAVRWRVNVLSGKGSRFPVRRP